MGMIGGQIARPMMPWGPTTPFQQQAPAPQQQAQAPDGNPLAGLHDMFNNARAAFQPPVAGAPPVDQTNQIQMPSSVSLGGSNIPTAAADGAPGAAASAGASPAMGDILKSLMSMFL